MSRKQAHLWFGHAKTTYCQSLYSASPTIKTNGNNNNSNKKIIIAVIVAAAAVIANTYDIEQLLCTRHMS